MKQLQIKTKESFSNADPNLVAVVLKIRGGVEHMITRAQADQIGTLGVGGSKQVRLASGDWINTADISSMTVDPIETRANLMRSVHKDSLPKNICNQVQFRAIAEAHAQKDPRFAEIWEAWKAKKSGRFDHVFQKMDNSPLT